MELVTSSDDVDVSITAAEQRVELWLCAAAGADTFVSASDWLRLFEGDTQSLRSHCRGSFLHVGVPKTTTDQI